MKMRFEFLFCNGTLGNDLLIKDIGMLPFHMHKTGYDVAIVSEKNKKEDYSNGKYLKGVQLKFVKSTFPFNFLSYLWKNANGIDVLMQFLPNFRQMFFAWFYKKLNIRGIAYIKADLSHFILNMNQPGFRNFVRKTRMSFMLRTCDMLSIENRNIKEFRITIKSTTAAINILMRFTFCLKKGD